MGLRKEKRKQVERNYESHNQGPVKTVKTPQCIAYNDKLSEVDTFYDMSHIFHSL